MAAIGTWPMLAGSTRAEPVPAATPAVAVATPQAAVRPNILWITSEDNGPAIGAYGDAYATTPNLDALAAKGYRYRIAWSTGAVCGASRTALITGVYPESTGGEHMRSEVALPAHVKLYPTLLREAGYYVTNNSKTDYNYPEVGPVWHESSGQAHYKNRPDGAPFFAIFNINDSHEGTIRSRQGFQHDVVKAPVPAHQPATQEAREDWAHYYDGIASMDAVAGRHLAELEASGLAEDTIVMYYGDHGAGLPRSKRFPYNSGLQIPLIVYVPQKFRSLGPPEASQPGSVSERLVSFIDMAPTLLSLAGVRPPDWMQGHAFMGPHTAPAPEFMFGFRGRADERHDLVRSVRDRRYMYMRNFNPHRPHGQHVAYLFQTPSMAAWKRLYDAGKLQGTHAYFWEPKASEELYDLRDDPHETRNLATSAAHREVLQRMRGALDGHLRATRDVGFLPEYEFHRYPDTTVYERRLDPARYDFDGIYTAAQRATDRSVGYDQVRGGLSDSNAVVRYWAAIGAVVRGKDAVASATADLEKLLADSDPGPRFAAAEALGRFGPAGYRDRAIALLVRDADPAVWSSLPPVAAIFAAQLSLYTLNQFTELSDAVKAQVANLPPVGGRGARGGGAAGGGRAGGGGAADGGRVGGQAPGDAAPAVGAAGQGRAGGGRGAAAGQGRAGGGAAGAGAAAMGGPGANRGDQRSNLKTAIANDVR